MKKNTVLITFGLLCLGVLGTSAKLLDPSNPQLGNTGAPGETTCQKSGCHSGGSFDGTVTITGIPDTIDPSTAYSVTVTLTSTCSKTGFEATVLDGDNIKAGVLTAGPSNNVASFGGKQYVRHSSSKNLSGGSASYSFTWTSPATAAGDIVTVYCAMLNGNGNGNDSGDNAETGSFTAVLRQEQTTGVETTSIPEINVSPVPTADMVYVTNLPEDAFIAIYNNEGRMVMHAEAVSRSESYSLKQLPAGTYHMVITTESGRITKSIFKQ